MNVKEEVSRNNNNLADKGKPSITKTVKRKDTEEPCSPLTVQDQVEAELAILRFDQDLAFGKEIPALQELDNENSLDKEKLQKRVKASTKNNSPIQRLDPFLENGILRVGGRLRCADLPHETKHPEILPWKSHVTTLLIRHAHKRLGHAGRGHVISNLREKYWIIKVNTAVRYRSVSSAVATTADQVYRKWQTYPRIESPQHHHLLTLVLIICALHYQGGAQGSGKVRRSFHVFG